MSLVLRTVGITREVHKTWNDISRAVPIYKTLSLFVVRNVVVESRSRTELKVFTFRVFLHFSKNSQKATLIKIIKYFLNTRGNFRKTVPFNFRLSGDFLIPSLSVRVCGVCEIQVWAKVGL